jgi:hypothetical protein
MMPGLIFMQFQEIVSTINGRLGGYGIRITIRDFPGMVQLLQWIPGTQKIGLNGSCIHIGHPGSCRALPPQYALNRTVLIKLKYITRKTIGYIGLIIQVLRYTPGSIGDKINYNIFFLAVDILFTCRWANQQVTKNSAQK